MLLWESGSALMADAGVSGGCDPAVVASLYRGARLYCGTRLYQWFEVFGNGDSRQGDAERQPGESSFDWIQCCCRLLVGCLYLLKIDRDGIDEKPSERKEGNDREDDQASFHFFVSIQYALGELN